MYKNEISRENNFDLLRLYAAIEVMIFHIFQNMGTNVDSYRWIQGGFNGVMIFYFISDFLITNSYLHSNSLKQSVFPQDIKHKDKSKADTSVIRAEY